MDFETNLAPYEGGAGNLDNTVACTNAVQTAGYNFDLSSGGYIAGNPAVVSDGTDPTTLGNGPLNIINQNGGARRKKRTRKSKRSKKLRRSNKSRLSTKSKKSRSKSRSKVRKSLRKSLKKKSRKSLK